MFEQLKNAGRGLTVRLAGGALALGVFLALAAPARADYYVLVPRTVYVIRYDHYGHPHRVAYTIYVKKLVRTHYP